MRSERSCECGSQDIMSESILKLIRTDERELIYRSTNVCSDNEVGGSRMCLHPERGCSNEISIERNEAKRPADL